MADKVRRATVEAALAQVRGYVLPYRAFWVATLLQCSSVCVFVFVPLFANGQITSHCTAGDGGSFLPGSSRARLFGAAFAAFSTEAWSALVRAGMPQDVQKYWKNSYLVPSIAIKTIIAFQHTDSVDAPGATTNEIFTSPSSPFQLSLSCSCPKILSSLAELPRFLRYR